MQHEYYVVKLSKSGYVKSVGAVKEVGEGGLEIYTLDAHVVVSTEVFEAKRYKTAGEASTQVPYSRVARVTLIEEELP